MRITGINNNADSVRVRHHARTYTKSELLAYARNVNAAKYADISTRLGKSTITHQIDGGKMDIRHKTPTRKNRKCIVQRSFDECGLGWDFFSEDEWYKNIIPYGNSDYREHIEQSDYAGIFNTVINEVMNYSYFEYAMHDIEHGYANREYKNGKELIRDYFGIDVTSHQVSMVRKALKSSMNDEDTICALMTALTPYTWDSATIRGYCQRDWQIVYYPTELYDDEAINWYEAFYMGSYMDYQVTYRDDTVCDFVPDFIAWDEDRLIEHLLDMCCLTGEVAREDVILKGFN